MLAEVFKDIDPDAIDIDITGYNEEEYKSITAALTEAVNEPELKDPDAEVVPPKVPTTKLGDIWRIGRHRLMCGDSTDKESVEMLLGGSKVDIVFTDPPYGIGIDGQKESVCNNPKHNRKAHEFMGWDNKRPNKEIFDFILSLNIPTVIFGGNYFADWLPPSRGWIYWDKGQDGLTMSDGELAWTSLSKPLRRVVANRGQLHGSVHPTQKPISIVAFCIEYAGDGEKVLDLFGGSGSTLITCEQIDRTCFMMELNTKYCDVIVRRYMQVTGKTDVVLLRDGKEIPVKATEIID
jgi:site-specific DNA-methyltransferase (adenine-specific)